MDLIKLFKKDIVTKMIPTKTEMDVLQVLWQYGPSTVRFIHDKLNEHKDAVIYTSTLKLMQGMKEKGMLERDETNMKHIYSAALKEDKVKGNLLDRFVNTVYNGSSSKLLMQLIGNKNTTKEDINELKKILKDLDKK